MIFESKISKIPCYVQAIKRGEEASFAVYDRRGYAANWLEKKLTEDEYFDIMEKVTKELSCGWKCSKKYQDSSVQ